MRFLSPALPACACFFVAAVPIHAGFVTSLASLAPNDSVLSWQGVVPTAYIPMSFVYSSVGGLGVSGLFTGLGGTVDEVCPGILCNYGPAAPGFNAGDYLIETADANATPSGPLKFTFSAPVLGAGLYLQLAAPGTFTATLAVTGGSSGSESVASDASGDPVFLGVLDGTADITAINVATSACTPSSPGGCSTTDFAVDILFLKDSATVPEPGTLLLVLVAAAAFAVRKGAKRARAAVLYCAGLALAVTALQAQDPIPVPPGGAPYQGSGTAWVRSQSAPGAPVLAGPALHIWQFSVVSPVDGKTYGGYMVGTSPFNRGVRSTFIDVVLIPVIAVFHNTTSGFMTTFDPTGTPDPWCTGNQTVMTLVENSPIFQNNTWIMNGVNVGYTQYLDAFRRANFWQYVKNTGVAYHTWLSYRVGTPMTLPVNYTSPTLDHEVFVVPAGSRCQSGGSGSTNAGIYTGSVNTDTRDAAVRAYITANGITADQFSIFINYNVVMSLPSNPGFFDGGYHASEGSPGQTYAVAGVQTDQFFSNANLNTGISILSHEVGEWMDDPGPGNPTPAWGHLGQVSGCQANLEVGDALTGTNLPGIAGPGGFTYFLQELVFYSWFFRIPATGAGGFFSSNGTFTTDAGPVCM